MPTKRRRTGLEMLTAQATNDAVLARLRVTAEAWGDELAKEILADEEFRAAFKALVRQAARDIVARLSHGEHS
jgi:hypothetical protein